MSSRFSDEFKQDAVAQITERGLHGQVSDGAPGMTSPMPLLRRLMGGCSPKRLDAAIITNVRFPSRGQNPSKQKSASLRTNFAKSTLIFFSFSMASIQGRGLQRQPCWQGEMLSGEGGNHPIRNSRPTLDFLSLFLLPRIRNCQKTGP